MSLNLATPPGQQVVNALRPFGEPLPQVQEPASFDQVLRTGAPAVGDLIMGQTTKQFAFAIRFPVTRDGTVKYVLSAIVNPESIFNILRAQQLPSDWIGVVVDRNKRFVARTLANEERLGKLASSDLQTAITASPTGWLVGRTTEGTQVYTAHETSPFSGWSVAIGIPSFTVEAAARQAITTLLLGTLLAVVTALLLARWLSRRIAEPIGALARSAYALTRGETVVVAASSISWKSRIWHPHWNTQVLQCRPGSSRNVNWKPC